ncbi:unnamed protein product [Brassica oleracea]
MSREDYLATAMLRSSDSKAGVSPSVRRQTSHNVHYVQVVQLLSERRYQTTNSSPSCPVRLESHKPPRVAPILQTGVRSRSFTDGGSLPLRRPLSWRRRMAQILCNSAHADSTYRGDIFLYLGLAHL